METGTKMKEEFQHFSCLIAHGLKRGVNDIGRCVPVPVLIQTPHVTVLKLAACTHISLCKHSVLR